MTIRTRRLAPFLLVAIVAAGCSGKESTSEQSTDSEPAGSDVASPSDPEATDSTEAPASTDGEAAQEGLSATTPAATSNVDSVTWALYREANTLDPIYAFDYPENTVVTSMCESLLLQEPDGALAPGLATLTRPDDLTMVFTLRDDVTFWDGMPVTADDVVFSLQRQSDPALGGFYGAAFSNVASIEATGPAEVTIALTAPDFWLEGELSSMPGIVLSKAFTEAAGAAYGTPDGGVMCTGAYVFGSWATGDRITVTANPDYWNGAPKVGTLEFIGVPDAATQTSGLLSGDLDGVYTGPIGSLEQLQSDSSLTVTEGPSFASAALIVSSLTGVLGDVNVRQALSMAIDRQGLVDTVYGGTGQAARAIANPGSWGYAPEVFAQGWDALPEVTRDIDAGRALVDEAGVAGETLVLATTNEIESVATTANVVKAAAEDIGLDVELRPVSAANYINLFIDPSAREGVDGFITVNYPDFADPAALYSTFVLPDGSQNYSGYDNPEVTSLMNEARATADPDARAELVVQAQAIIMEELPWIGLVVPNTVLITSADLTGAPSSFVYMNAPWAATLGGVS